MSWDNRISAISSLQELGVLTDAQCASAIGHPRLHELSWDPTPLSTLQWLLRNGIVDAASLLPSANEGRQGRSVEACRELIADTIRTMNQQSFDVLLAENLIAFPVHEIVSESLMNEQLMLTPAAAMLWVIEERLISGDEWQRMVARPSSQRSAAANIILADTVILVKEQQRANMREAWGMIFPDPFWAYLIGAPILCGLIFLYVIHRSAVPGCTSDLTRKPINATMSTGFGLPRAAGTYPLIHDLQAIRFQSKPTSRSANPTWSPPETAACSKWEIVTFARCCLSGTIRCWRPSA